MMINGRNILLAGSFAFALLSHQAVFAESGAGDASFDPGSELSTQPTPREIIEQRAAEQGEFLGDLAENLFTSWWSTAPIDAPVIETPGNTLADQVNDAVNEWWIKRSTRNSTRRYEDMGIDLDQPIPSQGSTPEPVMSAPTNTLPPLDPDRPIADGFGNFSYPLYGPPEPTAFDDPPGFSGNNSPSDRPNALEDFGAGQSSETNSGSFSRNDVSAFGDPASEGPDQ